MEWTVISLGGSIVVPDEIDVGFLKKFRQMIRPLLKKQKVALVIGGGKTARRYMAAAKKASPKVQRRSLDEIGIKATHLNEQLVAAVFEKEADKKIIAQRPKKVSTKKRMVLAAGWQIGASTDFNAVQLAEVLKAKTVINLTNVDYVYDKNPKKYKSAKAFKSLTWPEFKKTIGGKWTPGANVPFDPIASKRAAQKNLRVIVMNGKNLKNVKNCLQGKPFKGTVIQGK